MSTCSNNGVRCAPFMVFFCGFWVSAMSGSVSSPLPRTPSSSEGAPSVVPLRPPPSPRAWPPIPPTPTPEPPSAPLAPPSSPPRRPRRAPPVPPTSDASASPPPAPPRVSALPSPESPPPSAFRPSPPLRGLRRRSLVRPLRASTGSALVLGPCTIFRMRLMRSLTSTACAGGAALAALVICSARPLAARAESAAGVVGFSREGFTPTGFIGAPEKSSHALLTRNMPCGRA
mmetsp:Transcript_43455/g.120238  ORF Transcript_43455/g.120238 Transcript_43455/m.120238 type:complete len:231 (-) Transcript_43455:228-920(-)